jgi:large subunit ribosomal protein L24
MAIKKYTTDRYTPKFNIKTGDKVVVLSGDNRGSTGTVTKVITKENRALVGGLNMVKKHTKATENNPGGINEIEAPIHISNLQLVDEKTGKGTKVGKREESGKIVRYSKKSGEIIK